jgi:hypothetical protein
MGHAKSVTGVDADTRVALDLHLAASARRDEGPESVSYVLTDAAGLVTKLSECASDEHRRQLWSLVGVLFFCDPLRRREGVDRWLRTALARSVEERAITALARNDVSGAVFAYLSGRQLGLAKDTARDAGNLRLATLVSQAVVGDGHGTSRFRNAMAAQVKLIEQQGTRAAYSDSTLRVFKLLAGSVTDPIVWNAVGDDWKACFGLDLWFSPDGGSHSETDIIDAVECYERRGPITRDAIYSLLRLHAHRDRTAEFARCALDPIGHSVASPNDYS